MSISIQQNASNIVNKRKEDEAQRPYKQKKNIFNYCPCSGAISIFRSITNFEGKIYEFRD
jgi:hypothetical protein